MYSRMFLYILIAVMTCVVSQTTSSILPMPWGIVLAATLQGLIALRAFIDETPAIARKKREEKETFLNMD